MNTKSIFENRVLRFLFPFFLLFLIWILFRNVDIVDIEGVREKRACQEEKRASDIGISGIVLEKYLGPRRIKMLRYTDGVDTLTSELLVFEISAVYEFLALGDTIAKTPGSLDMRITRYDLDTLLRLSYGCK